MNTSKYTLEEKCQLDQNNYEELFIIIDKNNQDKVIAGLCDTIFAYHLDDESADNVILTDDELEEQANLADNNESYLSGKSFLTNFLKSLPKPITVVQEGYHIDRSFRDTYYMYFSNQHFQTKRYSQRLSFFKGKYTTEDYFSDQENLQAELEQNYIGSCVINPLIMGSIGRTLINPCYALKNEERPAYIRLSEFTQHIYGRSFRVKAFPYRMQDQETMCCAEVTLLNILDYYSNSYNDYKNVTPSEIITQEQKHSYERVLPARGVTYPVLTKVLSEFGFSPRLYNINAIDNFRYSAVCKADEFKRWLHYYIESGIPVALNLVPIGISGTGHSIICIGHGKAKEKLKKEAYKKRWIPWGERQTAHPIINSADFYDDYVVIDDNQPIYQIRNFKNLSLYADMQIGNLAVPLYKRMFLDAPNAYTIIQTLLHNEKFGINEWAGDFLAPGENVIIRLFMASTRSYKNYRRETIKDTFVKRLYTLIPMPQFVWICELYRLDDYEKLMAFGEIVIDATSAPSKGHRSLILMHYPKVIAYRSPDQAEVGFNEMATINNDALFPGYNRNLEKIES